MNKKVLLLLLFLPFNLMAQQVSVKGVVTDEAGNTIPGVTVLEVGTNNGAVTDFDGFYNISIEKNSSLRFSFIGFETVNISVKNRSVVNVELKASTKQLDEVVVTALGIRREKKALGYSVQSVKGDDLTTSKSGNVINQLSGKIAGLKISSTTGGPGSSSRIVLRGNNSLGGNNQALIVVDGVPLENNTDNTTFEWGGKDYGSGISDINPDDIESVSVLKGASASALYGSRASNGVVMITTKKGTSRKGIGIAISSLTSFQNAYILNEFQNSYGAGRNGRFEGPWNIENNIPVYNASSPAAYGSWGPKMEGQTIIDWDGKEKQFLPQPDNYADYFQTGVVTNNTIAISGGDKKSTYRLSFMNLTNKDIIPNTDLTKNNISMRVASEISSLIHIDASASYLNQKAENRLGLSNSFSVPRNYAYMPRHISAASLENNIVDSETGREQVWYTNWGWQSNPYWMREYELNSDSKDRFLVKAAIKFDFSDYLKLLIRSGADVSMHRFDERQAYNGISSQNGSYSNRWKQSHEFNSDFLLMYNREVFKDVKLNANLGGSVFQSEYEQSSTSTQGGLSIPSFYNVTFSNNPQNIGYYFYQKRINSLYATTDLSYKSLVFLNLTARNDWSSTLPDNNNSYFYPSANLGFVFSDAFGINNDWFTYGKIRATIAQVGSDTDPYRLTKTYIQDGNQGTFNGAPMVHVLNTMPLSELKPEITTSKELGADLRFFTGRLSCDFTYYFNRTKNQILAANISQASGSQNAIINSGSMKNSGVEFQISAMPIKKKELQWNIGFNYAKNYSEVEELADGVDNYLLLEQWRLSIEARPGHAFGDIVGYGIKRDENGNKIVKPNGMYLRNDEYSDGNGNYVRTGETKVLGNITPDWIGGVSSRLQYKNFSLNFHVDIRIGGEMFAGTNMYGYGYSGNYVQTLEGREGWYASEEARIAAGVSSTNWSPTGGYVAAGVLEDGTENSTYLNPEKYWSQFSDWNNEIHEPFIYDASYVKLRELTISYRIPEKVAKKMHLQACKVSVVGNNLWLIYSGVPNIDPESAYSNGNGQGYEIFSYPIRRSFGINVNLTL
ncbi:MAG: SusC/RagA family TonB-linked outer membrane protein [Bacteroidota bacterium]|nr:SusC/RagA family TonB-linked outer membrane protein [Bacteroidota bacterium]